MSCYHNSWPDTTTRRREGWTTLGNFLMGILQSFELLFMMTVILEYLLAFWTAPLLTAWLNGWNTIQDKMEKAFPNNKTSQSITSYVKRVILIFVILPTIIFSGAVVQSGVESTGIVSKTRLTLGSVLAMIYTTLSIGSAFVEDGKCVIVLKCVEVVFKDVNY